MLPSSSSIKSSFYLQQPKNPLKLVPNDQPPTSQFQHKEYGICLGVYYTEVEETCILRIYLRAGFDKCMSIEAKDLQWNFSYMAYSISETLTKSCVRLQIETVVV